MIVRVVKTGTRWVVIAGRQVVSERALKSKAVDAAFRYARRVSPSVVRIYSAAGKMQVQSEY